MHQLEFTPLEFEIILKDNFTHQSKNSCYTIIFTKITYYDLCLKRPQGKEFIFDPHKEQFADIHYDEDNAAIFNILEHEYQKGSKEILNNTDASEMASFKSNLDTLSCQNVSIWKLEKDTFFMVGDNRNHSFDSRFFGIIPYKFLVGKVRWQLFQHKLAKNLG